MVSEPSHGFPSQTTSTQFLPNATTQKNVLPFRGTGRKKKKDAHSTRPENGTIGNEIIIGGQRNYFLNCN